MKSEPRGVEAESIASAPAMPLISDDGVAQVRAVDTQLVCASRDRLKLDKGQAVSSLKNAQARLGGLARLQDSPLRLTFRVSTDRR